MKDSFMLKERSHLSDEQVQVSSSGSQMIARPGHPLDETPIILYRKDDSMSTRRISETCDHNNSLILKRRMWRRFRLLVNEYTVSCMGASTQ